VPQPPGQGGRGGLARSDRSRERGEGGRGRENRGGPPSKKNRFPSSDLHLSGRRPREKERGGGKREKGGANLRTGTYTSRQEFHLYLDGEEKPRSFSPAAAPWGRGE